MFCNWLRNKFRKTNRNRPQENAAENQRRLIWAEDFTDLSLSDGKTIGRWRCNDYWQPVDQGYADFAGNSWNVNPAQHPGLNPFAINNYGVLSIFCRKLSPEVQQKLLIDRPWAGGMLITEQRTAMFLYGYVEARIRFPIVSAGMFPAFWLYVADGSAVERQKSGAEIDVMEVYGDPTGTRWGSTVHQMDNMNNGVTIPVGQFNGDLSQWHTYGVDWQPDQISIYFDRNKVAQIPTQESQYFDVPMSIRLNYTVDAKWFAHTTDQSSIQQLEMQVDYVHVYDGFNGGRGTVIRTENNQ